MATGVLKGYHLSVDIMTLGHRQLPLEVFWFPFSCQVTLPRCLGNLYRILIFRPFENALMRVSPTPLSSPFPGIYMLETVNKRNFY